MSAFAVLHEDRHIALINKAAGITTHGAPNKTDTDSLAAHLRARYGTLPSDDGSYRGGLVHRLDKHTSGLLVIARSQRAYTYLRDNFRTKVHRWYVGLVYGVPSAMSGSICAPIGKDPHSYRKRRIDNDTGKPAVTHYHVLQVLGRDALVASLVRFRLDTGRTHQIRVHMAHLGYPIWGDRLYAPMRIHRQAVARAHKRFTLAEGALELNRQALHATELALHHPDHQGYIHGYAPLPTDIRGLLYTLRNISNISNVSDAGGSS
ncbi:MAG: RluA family pseudouridine synthase [Alphaproteobacteria bacterium GM202ARS2]|nr:RluA family pseudouridine synthase [Alphaproteobacteria bacterium GM202ARS2]